MNKSNSVTQVFIGYVFEFHELEIISILRNDKCVNYSCFILWLQLY